MYCNCLWWARCFNPRTYIRCDFGNAVLDFDKLEFQSTHLYKVRRLRYSAGSHTVCFNPRTYIRCDSKVERIRRQPFEFQSTHLYKVRRNGADAKLAFKTFQSTHLYKVRRLSLPILIPCFASFNPRTYIRCDVLNGNVKLSYEVSIHAPI